MTPSSENTDVRLEVLRAGDGQWAWHYVDESRAVRLMANVTQPTPEGAAASARRSFPDVDEVRLPSPQMDAPREDRTRELLRLAAALFLMGALFGFLWRRQARSAG
ncbi:MAG: hypothetical protein ACRDJL_07235 [Actinomycetota bacterium]